jgi:hypothetical protein
MEHTKDKIYRLTNLIIQLHKIKITRFNTQTNMIFTCLCTIKSKFSIAIDSIKMFIKN